MDIYRALRVREDALFASQRAPGVSRLTFAAAAAIALAACQMNSNADSNGNFGSGGTSTEASPNSVPSGANGTSGTQTTGYNTTGNANRQAQNQGSDTSPQNTDDSGGTITLPPPPPGYHKTPYRVVDPNCGTSLEPQWRGGFARMDASYDGGSAPTPAAGEGFNWGRALAWGAGGGGGSGGGKIPCH